MHSSISAAASAASAILNTAQPPSIAGAAALSFTDLLPPRIPPCSASEACPRGCEDPQQPGSVVAAASSAWLGAARCCGAGRFGKSIMSADFVADLIAACAFVDCSHLCVYLVSQRQAHERTCTQRPVRCGLCLPASDHWLAPRHVSAHVAAVLADPQRRAPIQQQMAKMILHGYGGAFFQTPAPGAAAAAAAPGSVINNNTPYGFGSRRRPVLESFSKG